MSIKPTKIAIRYETLPRRRISDEVTARLEQRIQSGEFGPGDPLPPERDLMEQYGVGRPAVREALFTLRKMGLVQVGSGRRARVAQPTPEVLIGELAGAAKHYLRQQSTSSSSTRSERCSRSRWRGRRRATQATRIWRP